mmetsp:Transcript_9336/g.22976  ORF Transcript_9336/g.22976 Transcript_9336/m.22976 type:complete len:275 (+) Transcript_9336:840-1664(+)
MGNSSSSDVHSSTVVTSLYCFVLSTYPPMKIEPNMMASWNPAPAMSMVSTPSTPARPRVSPMNADTALEIPMETMKATKGGRKPGVFRRSNASSGNGFGSTGTAPAFFAADELGGVGGASLNCTAAPMEVASARKVMRLKYSFMPDSDCEKTMPPTMNDVAMPIWFALMAIDVAKARSSLPNQVAESSVGVHWKKGCAAPTNTVPTTSSRYGGITVPGKKSLISIPERSAHPKDIRNPAPTMTFRRPSLATIPGSRKQKMTLVNRNTSIRVSAL